MGMGDQKEEVMIYRNPHALLINDYHRMISPVVPKNACSWQRLTLYAHKTDDKKGFQAPDMEKDTQYPKRSFETKDNRVDLSDYLDYSLVCFVREPIEKFISAVCELILRAYDFGPNGLHGDFNHILQNFSSIEVNNILKSFAETAQYYIDEMFKTEHFLKDNHTNLQSHFLNDIKEQMSNQVWFEVNDRLSENVKHWARSNNKTIHGLEEDTYFEKLHNTLYESPWKLYVKGYLEGVLTIPDNKHKLQKYLEPDFELYNEVKSLCYRGAEQ